MVKKTDESRWQKRPPISGMSIEEMQQRLADGIENRRKSGELPRSDLKVLKTRPSGLILTKQHRRVLIQAANLAIYSLANNEREDYCGACEVINAVRHQAGMPTTFMQAMLKDVAETAAELAGEPFELLDQLARSWLADYFTPSGKLISITKGKTNGNGQGKAQRRPETTSGDGQ